MLSREDNDFAEYHQERLCDLCERHILGCKSMTATFQCEGTRCEDAIQYLRDILEEERQEDLKYLLIKSI